MTDDVNWIREWLEGDWATWFEQSSAWSNTTQLHRAVTERAISGTGPTLMKGVSPTEDHVAAINKAIELAQYASPRNRQYINAALVCAILGSEKAAEAKKMLPRTLRYWRRRGEALLQARVERMMEEAE